MFLTNTINLEAILLNAVALEVVSPLLALLMYMHACSQFVLSIDNTLFSTCGTDQLKQLLGALDELPVRRRQLFQGLDANAVITFASLLSLLAVVGVTAIIPHVDNLRDAADALCGMCLAT